MSNADIAIGQPQTLAGVRTEIDQIDHRLVQLVAERKRWVRQANRFKTTRAGASASARVEAVIARVRLLADELGASPAVVESLYWAMIAAFIEFEDNERLNHS